MSSLVEAFCEYFGCCVHVLHRLLDMEEGRELMKVFLSKFKLSTTHLGSRNFIVKCGRLTKDGAQDLKAYRGFMCITVRQHYYARHRIHLRYPLLPCVCVYGGNGHESYFPMEVLRIV